MKIKIPLKDSVIAWTGKNGSSVNIYHQSADIPDDYFYTSGAAFTYWEYLTEEERYQRLLQEGWKLMLNYGFDFNHIHSAFLNIEEYALRNKEEA
jgi:hypothetical protein